MEFKEAVLVQTTVLFREARATSTFGKKKLNELTEQGTIAPFVDTTGRIYLNVIDAQVLFESLITSRQKKDVLPYRGISLGG